MTFNSATFIVFFCVFYAIYLALRGWQAKKVFLLLGGLCFYGWFNPYYLALIFLSTTIDYLCVAVIGRSSDRKVRKTALITSVASNLTILGVFKYFDFFSANASAALAVLGIHMSPVLLGVMLPIGISFYTFEAVSYAVDVYQRRSVPARSYLDLLGFITFFPHLVSGPIVRARDFLPQLETPRTPSGEQLVTGLSWIVAGYFFKVGVADNLAGSVDKVFSAPEHLSLGEAWLGALYFSFQIFGDFAGYTLIARGLAKLLGFELCANFDFPYLATGFSDFWRRWHMSLSSWLRDYLYIPLGGSRDGTLRTYRNLMITMLLGGLWHGASWNFVIWGGIHGLCLVAERVWRGPPKDAATVKRIGLDLPGILGTFLVVTVAWVFFRAPTLGAALDVLGAMLGLTGAGLALPDKTLLKSGVWLLPMGFYFLWGYLRQHGITITVNHLPARAILLAGLAFLTIVCRGTSDAFLYFQF